MNLYQNHQSSTTHSLAPLPVAALAAHGFLPEILDRWSNTGTTHLLPLQANAVISTGLLRGDNVLVLAPTSAGKTFIGEMAAVRQWQRGRRAVFLAPTRALAAEQYRHLSARYAPLGIRVALATADHTRHDARIRAGEFDFAVMVYEKLRAFLVTTPDLVYHLGAVIADEVQILGDPERGETADLLLTRLTRSQHPVQLIALSAVVDSARELSAWLGAQTLIETHRPVELREGVYCTEHRAFHYQSAAGAPWHDEELPRMAEAAPVYHVSDSDFQTPLVRLCADLARAGESCLVFVPTRPMSRQLCTAIAAELGVAPGASAGSFDWEALRIAEDCLARRQLMESAPAGVAFHNSDLTAELRAAIEQAFDAGHLRVVVATPTLAQGVNLRARNVIQVPTMLRGDGAATHARAMQVPISVERYRNQAGRAGRVGTGAAYGRSIVVAGSHLEAERLGRAYIQVQPGPLKPTFSADSMDQFVLDCVHSGIGDSYSSIHQSLAETFAWHSGAVTAGTALDEQLGESIRGLLQFQMLEESAGNRLRLTGLGQAMAAGGYSAATMRELYTACEGWAGDAALPGDFMILCACAFTADGEGFPLSASPNEIQAGIWVRAAREILHEHGAGRDVIRQLLQPAGGLSHAAHSSLKKAVVAHGWISEATTAELEERHRVVAGTTAAVGAHLAWIAGGLAACAAVVQSGDAHGALVSHSDIDATGNTANAFASEADTDSPGLVRAITQVARRLPQGLSHRAAELAALQITGLTRNYLNTLAAEGFDSVKSLTTATADTLQPTLPAPLAQRVVELLQEEGCKTNAVNSTHTPGTGNVTPSCESPAAARENSHAPGPDAEESGTRAREARACTNFNSANVPTVANVPSPLSGKSPKFSVLSSPFSAAPASSQEVQVSPILQLDRLNPGAVVYHGQALRLSPKPYAILMLLAQRCGQTVPYPTIDEVVWPEEKVEPQQISAHKSTIIREFARITSRGEAEATVVTDPRYGLRLNLAPEQVKINSSAPAPPRLCSNRLPAVPSP